MAGIDAKVTPFLWYASEAEEAARLYVSLFPASRIESVTAMPADSPSGPAGSVKIVEFTLAGQPCTAMSAGGQEPFNHAVSLVVNCEDQKEVDHYWDGFLAAGGKPEACGWLRDRYGLCWQITPTVLVEMMKDKDRVRARRVAEAMMKMIKLDIAGLEKAYEGKK